MSTVALLCIVSLWMLILQCSKKKSGLENMCIASLPSSQWGVSTWRFGDHAARIWSMRAGATVCFVSRCWPMVWSLRNWLSGWGISKPSNTVYEEREREESRDDALLFTLGTLLHATTLSLSLHLRYLEQVTKSHNVLFTQFYIFMCITLFDCGVTVNWYVLMGL